MTLCNYKDKIELVPVRVGERRQRAVSVKIRNRAATMFTSLASGKPVCMY